MGKEEHLAGEGAATAVGSADGWWDEAEYIQYISAMDDRDFPEGGVSAAIVEYTVRHKNLHLEAYLAGLTATEEADEAVAVLHEMMVALFDETAAQLELTTEHWPAEPTTGT